MDGNNLIIYKNNDGNIIVDAIYKNETLWLTQKGMSKVFDCSIDNISLHLKNIFKDNELDEKSVVEDSSVNASDGNKYKFYSVFYPVGNGRFNIGKSIEDINYIIDTINDKILV